MRTKYVRFMTETSLGQRIGTFAHEGTDPDAEVCVVFNLSYRTESEIRTTEHGDTDSDADSTLYLDRLICKPQLDSCHGESSSMSDNDDSYRDTAPRRIDVLDDPLNSNLDCKKTLHTLICTHFAREGRSSIRTPPRPPRSRL